MCPICKEQTWDVREPLSQIVGFPPQIEVRGLPPALRSTTTPMLPVVCETCGHVLWFDYAIAVGKNG
jgi:hypothetical protein